MKHIFKNNLKTVFAVLLIIFTMGFMGCGQSSKVVKENETNKANEVSNNVSEESKNQDTKSADDLDINEYIIPDAKGDWGYPTPYGLVVRGPGLVRMSFVFDTLLWKNEDGNMVPALAKSFEYDEEENTYIFELQENAKWHDGEKITAEDVIFTFNYLKEHPIKWLDISSVSSIEKMNDLKIKFNLCKKWAPFYSDVAGGVPILPAHIYKNITEPEKDMSKEAIIGSGPYKLVEYNKEKGEYVYEAFEDYYLGNPKVKKIKFLKMNPQMQVNALIQGKIDAASLNAEAVKMIQHKDMKIIDSVGMIAKFTFNHNKAPFDDKNIRQAIAYLIDVDEIIDIAFKSYATKCNAAGVTSDCYYYNDNIENYNYNVEKAAALLKKAGYEKKDGYYSKNGEEFTFTILGNERTKRVVDVIVEQLKRAGIKVNANYKEMLTADQMVKNFEFDVTVMETGGLGDPICLNRSVIGNSYKSDRYTKNEKIVNLLKKQLKETNLEQRKATLLEFQEIYADELPSYPIYFGNFIYGFDNKLELYYTKGGILMGVPLPMNKMIFVK